MTTKLKSTDGTTVELLTITPDDARELLKKNTSNRRVKEKGVSRLARDMAEQSFQFNGDAVRFYDSGELADGQHRLVACIESDQPFETLVVRGIVKEVGRTIDQGIARSPGDALQLAGFGNYHQLAASAKALICFAGGSTRVTPTTSEIVTVVEKVPALVEVCKRIGSLQTPGVNRSLVGALMAVSETHRIYAGRGDWIYSGLGGDHVAISRYPILHTIREYLRERARRGDRMHRNHEYFAAHMMCLTHLEDWDGTTEKVSGLTRPVLPEELKIKAVTLKSIGLDKTIVAAPNQHRMEKVSKGF